jgi:hypothetical protein
MAMITSTFISGKKNMKTGRNPDQAKVEDL